MLREFFAISRILFSSSIRTKKVWDLEAAETEGKSRLIKYPHLGGNEFLSEQMENHSLPVSGTRESLWLPGNSS